MPRNVLIQSSAAGLAGARPTGGAAMTPWVLVAGDVAPTGGMDRANLALAEHLSVDLSRVRSGKVRARTEYETAIEALRKALTIS